MANETAGAQFISILRNMYREAMRVTEQTTGMSQTRLEIMHDLSHVDEMSQAELQQRLGVEGAVVTRIIKQLEATGLVTRRADPQDNRFTLVALSPQGRGGETSAEATKFRATFGAQIAQGLTDNDLSRVLRWMAQIRENVKQIREDRHIVLFTVMDEKKLPQRNEGWQLHVTVMHLYRDVTRLIEQQAGMSQARLEILDQLLQADELSQADLQQHLNVEGAVVTRIVKQLEQEGLITRRADPRDNRFTLVALSPQGRQVSAVAQVKEFKSTLGGHLLAGLSAAERTQLLELLQRVYNNIRQRTGDKAV